MRQKVNFPDIGMNYHRFMGNNSDLQIEQDEDGLFIVYYSVLEYFLRSFLLLIQNDLAGGSAVSESMICKLEAGKRSVKATNLRRIALMLGISGEDFYHILENKSVMEELISRIEQDQPIDHRKVNQAMKQMVQEAKYNFKSLKLLVANQRYSHALFFLNRHIQSLLFALFIKTHQVTSPLVENNSYLLRTIDAKKATEQLYFLELLQKKLKERYITKDEFLPIIQQSMNLRKWVKSKLTEPMAPPPKLKYNRPKKALRKKIMELKESIEKN